MRYPDFWQRRGLRSLLLRPWSALVCRIARRRRLKAQQGLGVVDVGCPVMVIGNLTVGGTGKTPILMALARYLTDAGYSIGILSRGYGVRIGVEPRDVAEAPSPRAVGDEPWLIHQALGLPVMVHPDRVRAAQQLLARYPEVDLILSDDGLQHHRLGRTLQMVVVDGSRRFGNALCLPAGPLREPLSALDTADFIVVNGAPFAAGQWSAHFRLTVVRDLYDQQCYPVAEFAQQCAGQTVHALAGIGHPARFFDALRAEGFTLRPYPLDDHQPTPSGLMGHLRRSGGVVLMTEKDAVKWLNRPPVWHNRAGQAFVVLGEMVLDEPLMKAVQAALPAPRSAAPAAPKK